MSGESPREIAVPDLSGTGFRRHAVRVRAGVICGRALAVKQLYVHPVLVDDPVDFDAAAHRADRAGVDGEEVDLPRRSCGGDEPEVRGIDTAADLRVIECRRPQQLCAGQARHEPQDLPGRFDQEVRAWASEHGAVGAQADIRVSAEERYGVQQVLFRQRHPVGSPLFQLRPDEQPLVEGQVELGVGLGHRRDQLAVLGHHHRDVSAGVVADLGLERRQRGPFTHRGRHQALLVLRHRGVDVCRLGVLV